MFSCFQLVFWKYFQGARRRCLDLLLSQVRHNLDPGHTNIDLIRNVILKCLSTGNGLEYRAQPGFQNSQICQFGGEGDSNLITLFGIISWKLTWNPGYTRLGQFTHQVPFLELTALTEPANLEGAEEVNFPQVDVIGIDHAFWKCRWQGQAVWIAWIR